MTAARRTLIREIYHEVRPRLPRRAGRLSVLLALTIATGCSSKPKEEPPPPSASPEQFAEARARFAKGVAVVAAFGPLVTAKAVKPVDVARAGAAMLRISDGLRDYRTPGSGSLKIPANALKAELYNVAAWCSTEHEVRGVERQPDRQKACAGAVTQLEEAVATLGREAETCGAADFTKTLEDWSEPKREAEARDLVASTLGPDPELERLWNDSGATLEALDGACKRLLESRRTATERAAADVDDVLRCTAVAGLILSSKTGKPPEPLPKCADLPVGFRSANCQ
ncbi:MAG: hypothetical protein U0414_39850 [Polyangiaceae bacterium]